MNLGIFFSLDALMAAMVMAVGLVLISQMNNEEHDTTQLMTASDDLLTSLDRVRVADVGDPFVQECLANGSIKDGNLSVLEQIGHFWATNETGLARQLAAVMLDRQYSSFGIRLTIEDEELYRRVSAMDGGDRLASGKYITGIAKSEALTGNTALAYLRRVKDKRTLSFSPFGGFVGQGNITTRLPLIPADANITKLHLEMAVGGPFRVYFNEMQCLGDFTPSGVDFTPSFWDITACAGLYVPGVQNMLTLNFTGPTNQSYVTGGYLRARYSTGQTAELIPDGTLRQHLPGINGFINLYDAFSVPGTLRNLTVRLHYNSSYQSYFTIGDTRVYASDGAGEQTVVLTDQNLTAFPAMLDYSLLSHRTVPIRMASFNSTEQVRIGSNADVVLITDRSGSMSWRLNSDASGTVRSCSDPALYSNTTQRFSLAKCLDIEFTNITMNASMPNNLNREWLITYSSSASYFPSNPSLITLNTLITQIQSWSGPSGSTCPACALNLAYNILSTWSPSNKTRFVVLMTDGLPTDCTTASGFCNTTGTGTVGRYSPPNCDGSMADCSTNHCDGPIQAAINAARRLHNDLNVTVYTIGIGPATIGCGRSTYLLQTIATETNGSYYASQNASRLREIYREIAYSIITQANQTSQTVTVVGNVSPSVLYSDSYIELVYEPSNPGEQYGELAVTLQSAQFGSCAPTVTLPDGVRFLSSSVTSYSDEHWTDLLRVNGQTVFNLSEFAPSYLRLGDPYRIQVPAYILQAGPNMFFVNTADNPGNSSGCSRNNSLIYSVAMNLSTERTPVLARAEGCVWQVQYGDGETETLNVPPGYAGANSCSYRPGDIAYDAGDAYQLSTFLMFRRIDLMKNGTLYVKLREEDLDVIVTGVGGVPYLWGPSIVRLEVER